MNYLSWKAIGLATAGCLLTAPTANAQACFGTPNRSSVAFEHGLPQVGSVNGAEATLVRRRFNLNVNGRVTSVDPDVDGYQGALRLGLQFGTSRFAFCPALGVGLTSETWEPTSDLSLRSRTLSLRGGAGFGFEQPIYKGVSAIPFVAARYEFDAIVLDDAKSPDPETEIGGDTLSVVDIQYGLTLRYRFAYLGFAAQRNSDTKGSRPYYSHILLGFTFGSDGKPARRRSLPR